MIPNPRIALFGVALILALAAPTAWAGPALDSAMAILSAQAKAETSSFSGFSAERGGALFTARPAGGKPDTPSCTACHTSSPFDTGLTRAGKPIDPMALSKTPTRYADPKKLAKWFRRNCNGVLGRECTAMEKGDFLLFMTSR